MNTAKELIEFKQKYFTNNIYWVNEHNCKTIQAIAMEVGCLCHTMKPEFIEYHDGFQCLGFRTYEKNNNATVFQKEPFVLAHEKASDYKSMVKEYSAIRAHMVNKENEHI
jgi:hypothetical protein